MMEQAAAKAWTRCLRLRTAARSGSCRSGPPPSYPAPTRTRYTPSPSSICAVRHLSSSIPSTRMLPSNLRLVQKRSMQSSTQGTIGKGEAGIGDEAQRVEQALRAPEHLNEKEKAIWGLLMRELECEALEVQDISGGCGSMYGIDIVSERFRGLNMLKQQRLVNKVLGEEIKGWHGVQLKTRAP